MTNAEIINGLKAVRTIHNGNYAPYIDGAIKELKVIDKIRDEIESQRKEVSKKQSEDEGLSNYYFGLNDGLKDARDIIDKYKAERSSV